MANKEHEISKKEYEKNAGSISASLILPNYRVSLNYKFSDLYSISIRFEFLPGTVYPHSGFPWLSSALPNFFQGNSLKLGDILCLKHLLK
jgi:hypothetical protein